MKKITIDQYEDIEKYSRKIHFEIMKMVRNYSSFMAKELDSKYDDKFAELMLFKISGEISGNAFYLGKGNAVTNESKNDLDNMMDKIISVFEQYKNNRE